MEQERHGSGILYVAFGYEYLLMALHSAQTARETNPDLEFALVTNAEVREVSRVRELFRAIHVEDMPDELNRLVKTQAGFYSPFEKSLLLDCDTEVIGDLGPMFQCLDKFDVIAKLNSAPTAKVYEIAPGLSGPLFPTWSTGAIFFRAGAAADSLFSEWHRVFVEMKGRSDQPAFARMIYENPELRPLSITCIWNAAPVDARLLGGKAARANSRIWHYRSADEFPAVAQPLYDLHLATGSEFLKFNPATKAAIDDVQGRYTLMAKTWYQVPWMRRLLLGRRTARSLKRANKRTGERFAKVAKD